MSTRKLILTSIICALVIVLAGGIKLLQVANEDVTAELLALGAKETLSDMTVSVQAMSQTDSSTLVTVTMVGVEGADANEGWRLLADGQVVAPRAGEIEEGVPCDTTSGNEVTTCVVAFPATKGSVTVAYLRAGAQSQWATK